jgi:hypothetical protein
MAFVMKTNGTAGPAGSRPQESVSILKSFKDARRNREWNTVQTMIRCYCHGQHASGDGLCKECQELSDYASLRLNRCRFGEQKPTCAKCPVHCYERRRRDQIKQVMRYAGPRMIWQHPIQSLRHWLDGWHRSAKSTPSNVRSASACS